MNLIQPDSARRFFFGLVPLLPRSSSGKAGLAGRVGRPGWQAGLASAAVCKLYKQT